MAISYPAVKVSVQIRVGHAIKSGGDVALAKAFGARLQRYGFKVEYLSTAKQVLDFKPKLLIAFNLDQTLELLEICRAAKKCGALVAVYALHHPAEGMLAYLQSSLPGVRGVIARLVDADPAKYLFATALLRGWRRGSPLAVKYLLLGRERLMKDLNPLIDELLVSGPSELASIEAEFPRLASAKMRIVPHPVEFPAIAIPESSPYGNGSRHFFIGGRIESRKNQNSVLRVATQVPDAEFVFAGSCNESDPRYSAEFQRLLAISPNCRWVGQLSMGALLQYIACADAVLNPSWFEVMSLINLYAYALGTPVISCRHTFDPDLIPDGVLRYDLEEPDVLVKMLREFPARSQTNPRSAVESNRVKEFSASTWVGFDEFSKGMRERLMVNS